MNFNAFNLGPDGLTPWIRRFGVFHEFRPYPFGALVFYAPPTDSPYPGPKNKDGLTTKKWRNRLVPAIFVGISVGPGCQWERSYKVVPLASLLSEDRASRVSIQTVADVIFPEVCSFPLQQRLTLHGAYEDTTLPGPMVTDEAEQWAVIEEEGAEDLLKYDGSCHENAPKFRKTKVIEIMMAIDPAIGP